MSVCPHDTAKNKANWIEFVAYLSSHLDKQLTYAEANSFLEFREVMFDSDIVYANPIDAL